MTVIQDFADAVTVADLERDPYPVYRRLRAEAPVCYVPAVDLWLVTRRADVAAVGNDPDTFTAALPDAPVNRAFGEPNILTAAGATHRELRGSLEGKYKPREVARYIDDLVEPIVAERLKALEGKGEVDLLAEFFEPVSVRALAEVLGMGEFDSETLRRWFRGLAEGAINFEHDPARQEVSDATVREMLGAVGPLLDRMEREPDDSTLAHMLWSGREGDGAAGERGPRERSAVLPSLLVIILGGMQEPGHGAASTLYGLLSEPEQLADVLADPEGRCGTAVEEGIRWVSPIGTQARLVTRAAELGGVRLPAGAKVSAVLASANRDEAVFEEPELFRLDRRSRRSMPFGFGPHFCVGHAFARSQMRIALTRLLGRFPGLRLLPERPVEFRGWEFRAPTSLWVNLDGRG
ncbi:MULTISPECIES: cytochrome P450 [unclassified Streptomyces]|uniref:cytochrome P450 n=1 Tax=unclassified Streptomyces TaxID=2593676 RepID=UPI00278C135B|nr:MULTISPECIES: cytochrome P450 [unclassified Streptomyces]